MFEYWPLNWALGLSAPLLTHATSLKEAYRETDSTMNRFSCSFINVNPICVLNTTIWNRLIGVGILIQCIWDCLGGDKVKATVQSHP